MRRHYWQPELHKTIIFFDYPLPSLLLSFILILSGPKFDLHFPNCVIVWYLKKQKIQIHWILVDSIASSQLSCQLFLTAEDILLRLDFIPLLSYQIQSSYIREGKGFTETAFYRKVGALSSDSWYGFLLFFKLPMQPPQGHMHPPSPEYVQLIDTKVLLKALTLSAPVQVHIGTRCLVMHLSHELLKAMCILPPRGMCNSLILMLSSRPLLSQSHYKCTLVCGV